MTSPHNHNDPDGFFYESSALSPDPVYVSLRNWIQASPIGAFIEWVETRQEAREDRQIATEQAEHILSHARLDRSGTTLVPDREDRSGHNLAA
jgi:hypothetical protein